MDKMVGSSIKKVDNMISREVIKETKNKKIIISPIQIRILKYILNNSDKKEIFQRDIEYNFEIRRSTTSGILNTMEKNKLIERKISELDKRKNKIVLTKYGKELFYKIDRDISRLEEKIVNNISKKELDIFFKVIDKIIYNLEGE